MSKSNPYPFIPDPFMPPHEDDIELKVVAELKKNVMDIDELSIKTNLSQSKLAMILLILEMQGILVNLPGKQYQLA